MWDHEEELRDTLSRFGIADEDLCLVGGVVLNHHGIRPHRDIDIVVPPHVRSRLELGPDAANLSPNVEVVGRGWAEDLGVTDTEILENPRYHEVYRGLKMIRLEILFCVVMARNREKGQRDIRLLERYALDSPSWDWMLVKKCLVTKGIMPLQAAPSALAKSRWAAFSDRLLRYLDLARRGLISPRQAVRAFPRKVGAKVQSWKKPVPAAPTSFLQCQLVSRMPTGALLGAQFQNGVFARYDVLLRYLMVRSIVEGDERYRATYEEMQRKRTGAETLESLRLLVTSFQSNGFLPTYPIPITEEGLLVEGAHRLACALYFREAETPVCVMPTRHGNDFGRDWFEQQGFSEVLLTELDRTRESLFERHGVWFPLFLWPPASHVFDEIAAYVGRVHTITRDEELIFEQGFDEFVRRVYAVDDIDSWKVELKLHGMINLEPRVRLISLEIAEPGFRPKAKPRSYLSTVNESLKQSIRRGYAERIPEYFYDIICHTGDNHRQNQKIYEIIEEFRKLDTTKVKRRV